MRRRHRPNHALGTVEATRYKSYTDVVRQVDTPWIVKFFVIVVSFVTQEH